jgi:hypothetical protein
MMSQQHQRVATKDEVSAYTTHPITPLLEKSVFSLAEIVSKDKSQDHFWKTMNQGNKSELGAKKGVASHPTTALVLKEQEETIGLQPPKEQQQLVHDLLSSQQEVSNND